MRRHELGWLQKELAEALGADTATVIGWEILGRTPAIRFLPAIIELLGHNPLPDEDTPSGRVRRARVSLGLSQAALAKRAGLDESTVADFEAGRRRLRRKTLARLDRAIIDLPPDP